MNNNVVTDKDVVKPQAVDDPGYTPTQTYVGQTSMKVAKAGAIRLEREPTDSITEQLT